MNKHVITMFLLLILASFISAQTSVNGEWEVTNFKEKFSTGYTSIVNVKHTQSQYNLKESGMCWVKMAYVNPSLGAENLTLSRWLMIQPIRGSQGIGILNLWSPSYRYQNGEKDYVFAYRIDDVNSFPTNFDYSFSQLCNTTDETLIIYWYGSQSDYYNSSSKAISATPDDISGIKTVANNLNPSNYGKDYICLNVSGNLNETDVVYPYNPTFFGLTTMSENITFLANYTQPVGFYLTCNSLTFKEMKFIDVFIPNQGSASFIEYTDQLDDTVYTKHSSAVLLMPSYDKDDLLGRILLDSFIKFYKSYQKFLVQVLPEPVIKILFAVQEIFNLIILLLSVYLSYQVIRHFLAFRKSLKNSLSKAAIVFMQMVIWMVVILILLYLLSHVWTLCTLKAFVITQTLNLLGFGFQVPVSITDVGAIVWDLGLFSVIGTVSADCTDFYATQNPDLQIYELTKSDISSNQFSYQLVSLTCPGNLSISNLFNSKCPSIFIRLSIVFILLILLAVILGTVWELYMYIFRRVKSLEEKVRYKEEPEQEIDEIEE